MLYQLKPKSPTVESLTRGAPSNRDTFKEVSDAIDSVSSAASWSADLTSYDDSTAGLWATNVKQAIDKLDTKTDQIDVVWSEDYTAYVNTLI